VKKNWGNSINYDNTVLNSTFLARGWFFYQPQQLTMNGENFFLQLLSLQQWERFAAHSWCVAV